MPRRRLAPFLLVLLAVLPGAGPACHDDGMPMPAAEGPLIRGVTLDAREPPPAGTLQRLADLGVTHVTLITFAFQPGHDVPELRMHTDARWFSESDQGIRLLAAEAQALGMQILLKPHVWVGGWAGTQERHAIGFATETAWAEWEAAYRRFVLHYARLSEEVGAPVFCIGTELAGPARQRPDFWRRLIAEVRTVYSGHLTYAANWWDEYEHLAFWDALDYVGVQAYFPLSTATAPAAGQLRRGWQRHRRALLRTARRTGRPILFTEIGYRSVPGAAAEPWRWPSREEVGTVAPDEALQARLYEAFFAELWDEPWFAGAIVWKWYPPRPDQPDRPDRQDRLALDFTPQDKAAEAVIGRWFRQDRPAPHEPAPPAARPE